jgi:hypothetical protein
VDGKAPCKRQALGKDASESPPCTKTPPKSENPPQNAPERRVSAMHTPIQLQI